MPITIQEIIASDTISQLVDKTNFNFDQLLLNGGGPAGPAGPIGPVGPLGGRGPKGTTWYEDVSIVAPGLSPNVAPPTSTPLESDYYLQFNGQVWEYTGLTWAITTVDLMGPAGPAGQSGGFGLDFGGPIQISRQTAVYNGPIGFGNGADLANEGIPSVMIGGAVSNTPFVDVSIPLTSSYVIPDAIATTLNTPAASLMIHQKDATARGIIFHGGYTVGNPEKFEQVDISQLSSIGISNDDRLVLSATKQATSALNLNQVIGFEVNVPKRSQQYTAGKAITFQTGIENIAAFGGENSDFLIDVGTGSNAAGNKFVLTTAGTVNTTVFQAGGGFPVNLSQNSQVGVIQLQAGLINLTSSVNQNIQLNSGGQLKLDTTQGTSPAGQIQLRSATGGILATSSDGDITIQQSKIGGTADIFIENLRQLPPAGDPDVGGDIYIRGNSQIILRNEQSSALANPSIVLDYNYYTNGDPTKPLMPHTRFVGQSTWTKSGIPASTTPPNANTYQYNNMQGVLTGSTSTFIKTGDANYFGMTPGSSMHEWLGGTQTISGVSAGMIRVGMGSEGPSSPVPAYGFSAWDNSLTISVRSFNEYNEYFSANSNKTAIAGTYVHKRDNNTNSVQNSNPMYDYASPQVAPYEYGWDLVNAVPSFSTTFPTPGAMPLQADLNKPVIFLNFGYGLGYDNNLGGGGTLGQQNYLGNFNFPTGLYPGQKLTVIIKNQATLWTQNKKNSNPPGQTETLSYYGTVRIHFPRYRIKIPSSSNVWESWMQTGNFGMYDGFHTIDTTTNAGHANQGATVVRVLDLIWDGAESINRGRNYSLTTVIDQEDTKTEWGWVIISDKLTLQGGISGYETT
jgi:hypothetical protein